jgi:hypothetical protein
MPGLVPDIIRTDPRQSSGSESRQLESYRALSVAPFLISSNCATPITGPLTFSRSPGRAPDTDHHGTWLRELTSRRSEAA